MARWSDQIHEEWINADQLNLDAERVCLAMWQHRASLRNPTKTIEDYLATLGEQGLSGFSQAVQPYATGL